MERRRRRGDRVDFMAWRGDGGWGDGAGWACRSTVMGAAVVGLLVWGLGRGVGVEAGTGVERSAMRYQRTVQAGRAGLNCAVVDPAIFAHAASSLRDMRLVGADGEEVAFVLTLSGTGEDETEAVAASGVEGRGSQVEFDLRMPGRPYTDVVLDLAGTDFVATAVVTVAGRALGQFAVWDLSKEGLGRSTTLHLQETAAPVLQVELSPAGGGGELRPEMVRGATVPPARSAQARYTVAARAMVRQEGGATVGEMELPARVPVERVRFVVGAGGGSFRRAVRVEAKAEGGEEERVTGEIDRLHAVRDGVKLDEERLSVQATLGANLQGAARVLVEVENGGAAALPIRAVELETRERQVCFDAGVAGERMELLYGDPGLHAPVYPAYLRRYAAEGDPAVAVMGAEARNPGFTGERDARTERERHPRLVYLGIVLVVCCAGLLLFRTERLRMGGGGR